MKIGQLVKAHVPDILRHCETVDHGELARLLTSEYAKEVFGLGYPFLADAVALQNDAALSKRYWTDVFVVRGRSVRACSQWFEGRHREPFLAYLDGKGIPRHGAEERRPKPAQVPGPPSRYRGNAIGNAQNLVVRNILSNLGDESFSKKDWEQTKTDFDHRCAYCGERAPLEIEHAVPINRTALGEHRLGNLVPACHACNRRKGGLDFREFLGDDEETIARIEAHMERHNYVPLGENRQVQAIVEMAYREVGQLAERYVKILNGLHGTHGGSDDAE